MKFTKTQLRNLIKKELQLEALTGNPMDDKVAQKEIPGAIAGLQQGSVAMPAQMGVLQGIIGELMPFAQMGAQAMAQQDPGAAKAFEEVMEKVQNMDKEMEDAAEKEIKKTMKEGCSGGMAPAPYIEEDPHESHGEGRMAKSQLYKAAHYAQQLHNMIEDGEELDAWIQAKITKASDYLDSVRGFLEYEMMPNRAQAIALQEGNLSFSKNQLKQVIAEELASLSEYGLAPGASLGDEGQPSPQDVLRSSIMDAIDLLKAGNTEDALGTLEATLDAYTGSGELDSAVQDEG